MIREAAWTKRKKKDNEEDTEKEETVGKQK